MNGAGADYDPSVSGFRTTSLGTYEATDLAVRGTRDAIMGNNCTKPPEKVHINLL